MGKILTMFILVGLVTLPIVAVAGEEVAVDGRNLPPVSPPGMLGAPGCYQIQHLIDEGTLLSDTQAQITCSVPQPPP